MSSSITYVGYSSELQLPSIIHLIENDLSEPYSIYTYRYFIHNWPDLCFLVTILQQIASDDRLNASRFESGHGRRKVRWCYYMQVRRS